MKLAIFLAGILALYATVAEAKPRIHYVSPDRIGWECFAQWQHKGCAFPWTKSLKSRVIVACDIYINRALDPATKRIVLEHELQHCAGKSEAQIHTPLSRSDLFPGLHGPVW